MPWLLGALHGKVLSAVSLRVSALLTAALIFALSCVSHKHRHVPKPLDASNQSQDAEGHLCDPSLGGESAGFTHGAVPDGQRCWMQAWP